jgi:DNA-binding SARP family transcriptional activator
VNAVPAGVARPTIAHPGVAHPGVAHPGVAHAQRTGRWSTPGEPAVTSVKLLHSFELRHGPTRVLLAPGAQRLLAFLALDGGTLTRAYVAGSLWIDSSQESANANLRTALWRLRRVSCRLVDSTATHLSLAPEVLVDLHSAREAARHAATAGPDFSEEQLERILSAGELLPDWYDDWLVIGREQFRQARLHALEALCGALTRTGDFGKAIEVGLAAVAGEPLRESAHRAVMRAHLAEGNRHEAARQYELCRRALAPLGLMPSPETHTLWQRCRSSDGGVTLP